MSMLLLVLAGVALAWWASNGPIRGSFRVLYRLPGEEDTRSVVVRATCALDALREAEVVLGEGIEILQCREVIGHE